VVAGGGKLT